MKCIDKMLQLCVLTKKKIVRYLYDPMNMTLVLTVFNEEDYLIFFILNVNLLISTSICFSLIVKSCSNPFLKPTIQGSMGQWVASLTRIGGCLSGVS